MEVPDALVNVGGSFIVGAIALWGVRHQIRAGHARDREAREHRLKFRREQELANRLRRDLRFLQGSLRRYMYTYRNLCMAELNTRLTKIAPEEELTPELQKEWVCLWYSLFKSSDDLIAALRRIPDDPLADLVVGLTRLAPEARKAETPDLLLMDKASSAFRLANERIGFLLASPEKINEPDPGLLSFLKELENPPVSDAIARPDATAPTASASRSPDALTPGSGDGHPGRG